jgi:hypothetical protein
MIINKEVIPGTRRYRCTFDSGTVLESQLVFLKTSQWKSLEALAALNQARVSEVIGKLIDNAAMSARNL